MGGKSLEIGPKALGWLGTWLLAIAPVSWAGCFVSFENSGTWPGCGDGALSEGEGCDDGNSLDGDGCSSVCTIEEGWACRGSPSECTPVCGDSVTVGPESCDGSDLRDWSCEALGLGPGVLVCRPDCSGLDASGCTASVCGDGLVSGQEVCDGTRLNGKTCEDFGFAGGHLACKTDCTDYDTAECSQSQCGNGVLDPGEECDNGPGNSDSEPDACRTDCHWAHCGDGVADSGEACDGTDFGGETCESLVAGQGDLACSQCAIDASGCLNRAVGAPCETVDQCAGDRCFTEADRGFPGGYCSQACEDTPCPTGAMCVAFQNGQQEWDRCMDLCSDGTPCRSGYVCGSASNDPSVQFCAPESWQ